jgi:riboflavin synthase
LFTGIVEDIGHVLHSRQLDGDLRLRVAVDSIDPGGVSLGDSIAVNGACLTVVGISGRELDFDVSRESLAHTIIGSWNSGTRVNLEQALLPTTRLGGHLVSGHVDGVGSIAGNTVDARSSRVSVSCPAPLRRFIAKKGSVTIDGVSLTVNELRSDGFEVNIVPHTLKVTTLGDWTVGVKVHLEVDQVARYIDQLLTSTETGDGLVSVDSMREKLANSGFME